MEMKVKACSCRAALRYFKPRLRLENYQSNDLAICKTGEASMGLHPKRKRTDSLNSMHMLIFSARHLRQTLPFVW